MADTSAVKRLRGDEYPAGATLALPDARVRDFWQWAFSDLRDNTLRGAYCEWLVAYLLGVPLDVRVDWEPFDLRTPEGWRIEVKSAAYQQAWHNPESRPSTISFGRLKSRSWTPDGGLTEERCYNADVYIFCLNTTRPGEPFEALNLDQWEFYVVPVAKLAQYGWRSI